MADAPNLNQLTDLTTAQRLANQGFLAGQRTDTGDFLSRYTGAIGGQETSSAMANRIGGELNLPQLRANSQGLQNTLYQLPGTYNAATTGHDVNNNQLSRIIGQKYSELAPAASLAQSNLATAEGQLDTRMGYAQSDQAKALLPYQSEQSLLTDRLAREATMYSQDNERELNSLITKIQAGITLSEGEKTRANQLAIAEKSYQATIEAAKINNQPKPFAVANGSGVYNPSNNTYQQFGWG